MKVKFKSTCKELIAKVVGNEVGNVTCVGDGSYTVEFPLYGAEFGCMVDWLDVVE